MNKRFDSEGQIQVARNRYRCRKHRYRDHAQAVRAIHRFTNESTRDKIPVRAYPCAMCGGWHLTSQTEWQNGR